MVSKKNGKQCPVIRSAKACRNTNAFKGQHQKVSHETNERINQSLRVLFTESVPKVILPRSQPKHGEGRTHFSVMRLTKAYGETGFWNMAEKYKKNPFHVLLLTGTYVRTYSYEREYATYKSDTSRNPSRGRLLHRDLAKESPQKLVCWFQAIIGLHLIAAHMYEHR